MTTNPLTNYAIEDLYYINNVLNNTYFEFLKIKYTNRRPQKDNFHECISKDILDKIKCLNIFSLISTDDSICKLDTESEVLIALLEIYISKSVNPNFEPLPNNIISTIEHIEKYCINTSSKCYDSKCYDNVKHILI